MSKVCTHYNDGKCTANNYKCSKRDDKKDICCFACEERLKENCNLYCAYVNDFPTVKNTIK